MKRLFDIVDSKIVPNSIVIAIPIMKKIWDRDKSKDKELAFKEYSYIVFLCDFHSPYWNISDDIKEGMIRNAVFGNTKWEPDETIKEAIKVYEELQETRHLKMLKSYQHIEDQITSYNNKVNFEDVDDWGKPKYNIKDIVQSAEKIGNIIKSISLLEKQVQVEITDSMNVRGQTKIGPYELPRTNKEKSNSSESLIEGGE